jgi:hypothetical protein
MMFIVCIGAAAIVMQSSGLATYTGLDPHTGVQDDIKDSKSQYKNYSASTSGSDSGIVGGIFGTMSQAVSSFGLLNQSADLLMNLGLPGWLATFIVAPVPFILGFLLMYLVSGRRPSSRI